MELNFTVAVNIFRRMLTIRLLDERIQRGLKSGEFRFQYYPVRGQEAIPAALAEHLNSDDYMTTTYRCLHDCVAKGVSLRELLAEMCGKSTGTSKGKGGPMHLSDPQAGLMVTSGIVGAGLPIANGLALSAQLRDSRQISVASFGDGATSIGASHEALNLAALWNLPVIFVCQHNQYAEHTRFEDYTKTKRLSDRARPYGMAAVTCDGNDVEELYGVFREAVAQARDGSGPTFVECLTHRLEGHSFGSSTDYMGIPELSAARENEPVAAFREAIVAAGAIEPDGLLELEREISTLIADAVEFSLASPFPGDDELETDVLAAGSYA